MPVNLNLKPGERVLVEAEVIKLKPERDGYIDVKIYDHYYYAEDGTELEDAENLRLPAHHIHPLTSGQAWRPITKEQENGSCTHLLLYTPADRQYGREIQIGWWDGHWMGTDAHRISPTHWMPLPPLPSSSGEGERTTHAQA